MTGETTNFVYVTYIVSTPEKVFEAITKPDIARRYWAHENISDWQPGSKWEHVDADGNVKIAGKVIECTPPKRLSAAGYEAGPVLNAYVNPFGIGDIIPDTPLFMRRDYYVMLPLEETYMQAFNSYLGSTVHVAHAHRMRGQRWADDPAATAAMQRKVP